MYVASHNYLSVSFFYLVYILGVYSTLFSWSRLSAFKNGYRQSQWIEKCLIYHTLLSHGGKNQLLRRYSVKCSLYIVGLKLTHTLWLCMYSQSLWQQQQATGQHDCNIWDAGYMFLLWVLWLCSKWKLARVSRLFQSLIAIPTRVPPHWICSLYCSVATIKRCAPMLPRDQTPVWNSIGQGGTTEWMLALKNSENLSNCTVESFWLHSGSSFAWCSLGGWKCST